MSCYNKAVHAGGACGLLQNKKGNTMVRTVFYVLLGYLLGSILFARVAGRLFHRETFIEKSGDRNPGTVNAFVYGGMGCGVVTLAGDLLKGFLPVFLYHHLGPVQEGLLPAALVLAAPVLGHAYPLFFHFEGGKGIAVTFGCLLGLLPAGVPFAALAFFFIFFSVVVKISPNFYRTYITYFCTLALILAVKGVAACTLGFLLITCIVGLRLHMSKEEREKLKVKVL